MNEIQAAFDLMQLKYVDESIKKMREIARLYGRALEYIANDENSGEYNFIFNNQNKYPQF